MRVTDIFIVFKLQNYIHPSAGIVLAICLMFPNSLAAQFDDACEILRSGVEDANILLTEYLKPFGKGFGTGFPYVPSPMIQLTVGFIKDTDLSIRYVMQKQKGN